MNRLITKPFTWIIISKFSHHINRVTMRNFQSCSLLMNNDITIDNTSKPSNKSSSKLMDDLPSDDSGGLFLTTKIKVDFRETTTEYTIDADLPGVDRSGIRVHLDDGSVVIEARRHYHHESSPSEDTKARFHIMERSSSNMLRSIPLPSDADTDFITARLVGDTLIVSIPKKEPTANRRREIDIE
mmetsp:Transcript_4059/g.6292  ORF Transcript_4059/g.6292 Transcript_4059/m.6292 type:complete len:185 (+) Transcript_4059:55-609(+)